MIGVKNYEVLESLQVEWHPKLRKIVEWLCKYKEHVVITCGYEKRNYASTHSVIPLRAIDIRSWIYRDPAELCTIINNIWIYDPNRPAKLCAMYHDSGSGFHIHIQIHEDTVRV